MKIIEILNTAVESFEYGLGDELFVAEAEVSVKENGEEQILYLSAERVPEADGEGIYFMVNDESRIDERTENEEEMEMIEYDNCLEGYDNYKDASSSEYAEHFKMLKGMLEDAEEYLDLAEVSIIPLPEEAKSLPWKLSDIFYSESENDWIGEERVECMIPLKPNMFFFCGNAAEGFRFKITERSIVARSLDDEGKVPVIEEYATWEEAMESEYKEIFSILMKALDEDAPELNFTLPETEEDLYKVRLSLETNIETPSVFNDMDYDSFKLMEKHLSILEKACNEADYQAWKEKYIEEEYQSLKNEPFLCCKYLFAGIGQYEAIIPKNELDSFQQWIGGNGSAFFGGEREATEEDVKTFIALHAADDVEEENEM